MHAPVVTCEPTGDGWRCHVVLADASSGRGWEVRLDRGTFEELASGTSPEVLVAESFRFLLEREPPDAILRSFDLPDIERYFPEFRAEMLSRLRS